MEISLLERTIKGHIDGYFKDDYTLLESDKLNASFYLFIINYLLLCINGLVCNGFNEMCRSPFHTYKLGCFYPSRKN